MNIKIKYLYTILCVFILVLLFINSKIWQRQPVVFYEPIFYPLETLEDDIIITPNGERLVIRHDMKINSIEYKDNTAVIKGTRHITLWEYITEQW